MTNLCCSDNQRRWLNSLVCERLKDNDQNERSRILFENDRVESLQDYITGVDCLADDESNKLSVYVVKNSNNDILAFFSLRCGLIYDDIPSAELIDFYHYYNGLQLQIFGSDNIEAAIEDYKIRNDLDNKSFDELLKNVGERYRKIRAKQNDEHSISEDRHALLVDKTYGAVQLVHFCKNVSDNIVQEFPFNNNTFGEIVFWHFIYRQILKTQNVVGFEQLYLFAAINTDRNDSLALYYENRLGFNREPMQKAVKPLYESGCLFMTQTIEQLKERHISFWNHINVRIEDPD